MGGWNYYQGTILDYNKAIEINPTEGKYYFRRGLAKIKSGQTDSGCLDLNKAKELGYEKAADEIKNDCK